MEKFLKSTTSKDKSPDSQQFEKCKALSIPPSLLCIGFDGELGYRPNHIFGNIEAAQVNQTWFNGGTNHNRFKWNKHPWNLTKANCSIPS
jgi:hypothetical protein